MTRLAIFDYGAGNIFSLKNSLERAGASVDVISDLGGPHKYDGLLLPGVGSFDPALRHVAGAAGPTIPEYAGKTTPVLGICLGMEMFFESSQEGSQRGLGIMAGHVVSLPPTLKVPHMGWNDLAIKDPGRLLGGVQDGQWVYFVHSYMASPKYKSIITAESDYGMPVPAVVEQDNYFGTQFHPEKSGRAGQVMLENFIRECRK